MLVTVNTSVTHSIGPVGMGLLGDMNTTPPVVWLGEASSHNPAIVGGKAANLSRIASRYTVPEGFCLPPRLVQAVADVGSDGPKAMATLAVERAYRRLEARRGAANVRVAVRSSAIDEDGGAASFAGQHETLLNISGLADTLEAIQHCWRSAQSERALAYRQSRNLIVDRVQLAVLVQLQLAADISVVAFSANPITGSRDEIVVNATWGLGESLVGGTATPDTYIVDRHSAARIARQIGAKQRMTIPSERGTREIDTPRFMRQQPALTEAALDDVVRLTRNLEADFGFPVDVEAVFADGQIHLVQCRPITTLAAR